MYQYPFEKLEVWKMAKDLAKSIYQITQSFPTEEKYGMVSQMRRIIHLLELKFIKTGNLLFERSEFQISQDFLNTFSSNGKSIACPARTMFQDG